MKFDWNEEKRKVNLKKHGVDFDDALKVFKGFVKEDVDDRWDYNEITVNLIGLADSQVLVVTYTLRDSKHRIISARRANSRERRKYYDG